MAFSLILIIISEPESDGNWWLMTVGFRLISILIISMVVQTGRSAISRYMAIYVSVEFSGVNTGFLSPTIGYRLNWGRKANLNLGLGMTFRGYGWSDEKTLHPQLSVRIGVDF